MVSTNNIKRLCLVALILLAAIGCVPHYSFNGASIDYTKTKTITIVDFPIRSSYVWGPMASIFNNRLKDQFADHTRLSQRRPENRGRDYPL